MKLSLDIRRTVPDFVFPMSELIISGTEETMSETIRSRIEEKPRVFISRYF